MQMTDEVALKGDGIVEAVVQMLVVVLMAEVLVLVVVREWLEVAKWILGR